MKPSHFPIRSKPLKKCVQFYFQNYSSALQTGPQEAAQSTDKSKEDGEIPTPHIRSSLFLPGNKAHQLVAIVKPDVDFESICSSHNELKLNLMYRNYKQNNLDYLIEGWKKLKTLREQKENLNIQKNENHQLIKSMDQTDTRKIDEMKNRVRELKKNIQELDKLIWELEDEILIPLLFLPNRLHPNTPSKEDKLISSYFPKVPFDFPVKSHVELGRTGDQITFSKVSPTAYFLKGPTALFEHKTIRHFSKNFRQANFFQTSNPDFCKPPIAEACGRGYLNSKNIFMLKTSKKNVDHLTGGASLTAFSALFARIYFEKNFDFPLRYFTIGRCYNPLKPEHDFSTLFNVVQTTRLHFFSLVENDSKKTDYEYEKILEIITAIYGNIGIHFQLTQKHAGDLDATESLRTSLQMWSPNLEEYVEVANVSICDDYVSRRLMSRYKCVDGNAKNFSLVHGVGLCLPKLLACVMENSQDGCGNWKIPDVFCK